MLTEFALLGRVDIVDLLIKPGADVNGSGALIPAASSESVECVKLLMEAGAEVNNMDGSIALCRAAQSGSMKCVNMLLQAGADVNSPGYCLKPVIDV